MKPAEHSFSGTDLCAWCPHFDHHDPALTYDNVCQVYDHLQHECLVAWSDGYDGFWILSRYADIVTALMDSGTFSSGEGVHRLRTKKYLCPGATLARTELRILLEELLNAHPPFELAGSAV